MGDVNKLFVFKSLLTMPSNVLPLHLKQTFPPIIWIFIEGEGCGIESRLTFKIFSTLLWFSPYLLATLISKKVYFRWNFYASETESSLTGNFFYPLIFNEIFFVYCFLGCKGLRFVKCGRARWNSKKTWSWFFYSQTWHNPPKFVDALGQSPESSWTFASFYSYS